MNKIEGDWVLTPEGHYSWEGDDWEFELNKDGKTLRMPYDVWIKLSEVKVAGLKRSSLN